MLSQADLIQVRNYVIRILPEILRQEPEVSMTIEGILAQQFPRRDEFARLLDEIALLREDTNQRFNELREDMNQRFEQVDQRFEQVDRRFNDMHRTQLGIKRDILQLQEGQTRLLKQMEGQEKWLRLTLGELRNDKGEILEDMFAEALRYGLNNPDIVADQIQLRQPLFDPDGQVFRKHFATEIDVITDNHQRTVFEVKASASVDEVYLFSLKVKLVTLQNPDKPVHGVFICLGASEVVQQQGAEYGLEVIV